MHLEEDASNDEGQESDDPGRIEGVTEEFMVCLARAVKDTQADEKFCYHCSSPEHFICNCPLVKTFREKKQLNGKEGMALMKGAQTPLATIQHYKEPPDRGSQGINLTLQTPFLNLDPFQWWYGAENIARVKINGESCMALLDNGAQINTIMPRYVSDHSLLGAKVTCVGLGNAYTRPFGYVMIWVQVDGVQGYDEDQIALVIPDLSNFSAWIPIILGAPTISQVINMMKEADMDVLVMLWANARAAHLLSVCRMLTVEVGDGLKEEPNPDGYDQVMFTQNVETIEPFSSCVVLVKAGRAYTGECINIMVQALQTEDGSLPQGLTVQNMYTELRQGSKKAIVVVRNSRAYLQTLQKRTQWLGSSCITSAQTT